MAYSGCRLEAITVDASWAIFDTKACVIDVDGAKLALYQTAPFRDVSVLQLPESEFGVVYPVMRKPDDRYFHFVYGLTDNGSYFGLTHPVILGDGGAILTVNGSHGRTLMMIENLAERVTATDDILPSIGRQHKFYELDFLEQYRNDHNMHGGEYKISVDGELDWIGKVRHMAGVSNNGRYIAVEVEAGGTVVADLVAQKIIKHIDTPNHQYHVVNGYAAFTKFAVSDDGKMVMRLGVGHRFYPHEHDSAVLYFVDETCQLFSQTGRYHCRYIDFTEQLRPYNTETIRPYSAAFNSDESALLVRAYDEDDDRAIYTTMVRPSPATTCLCLRAQVWTVSRLSCTSILKSIHRKMM